MTLPNTLKELHALCEQNGLKYKGKTKVQLKALLENKDEVTIEPAKTDFAVKSVKELKETCESLGLSKCGVKAELIKRLESFHNGTENGLRVVEWRKRGRKAATRPSESVHCDQDDTDTDSDDESQDDDCNEYKKMKKHELRQECLKRNIPASGTVKLLIARLRENDDIASKVDTNNPEKVCESCEENPSKLYKFPAAKWFCQDCEQYICNLCKDAHEKLKITRTHVITP